VTPATKPGQLPMACAVLDVPPHIPRSLHLDVVEERGRHLFAFASIVSAQKKAALCGLAAACWFRLSPALPPRLPHNPRHLGMRSTHGASLWCRLYAFDVHCNSYFPLFVQLYSEYPWQFVFWGRYSAQLSWGAPSSILVAAVAWPSWKAPPPLTLCCGRLVFPCPPIWLKSCG
jgi:hypothetical protein